MSFTKLLCLIMSSILKVLKKGDYKHQKLLEDWEQNKEPLLEGLTFYVKYLGSCLVESSNGEKSTATAVKSIVAMTKIASKKLERVSLSVSPENIKVINVITHEQLFEVPINRISYCSADAQYNHVFAFIQSNKNDLMECHAFLCSKRKMAQAVTLTISQAFNVAYDLWETAKTERMRPDYRDKTHSQSPPLARASTENKKDSDQQVCLIDLNYEDNDSISKSSLNDDYLWQNSFAQFNTNASLCALESSLGDASISQFVIGHPNSHPSAEFFRDDANDLMLL